MSLSWFVRLASLVLMALAVVGGTITAGVEQDQANPNDPAKARLTTTMRRGLFLTTVRSDGREAGPFLIDSGADGLVLDRELASTLGPATLWRGELGSASVRNLAVGPIYLRAPPVVIMDLSPVTHAFGERLAGVLGYPFFQSAVVEVDYVRQSVSCFEPFHYKLLRGVWEPLTLKGHRPGVTARVEGAEGLFLLDTGSTAVVRLFPHFLRANPQLMIRSTRPIRHWAVGGEHEMLAGRIGWFEMSGYRLEGPWVTFEKPDVPGPHEATWFDGIVGEEALRRFVVVFNYPARKIAFLPAGSTGEAIP